jgi:hypothetical protein
MAGMLAGVKEKVELYTCTEYASNNFIYAVDQIYRNLGFRRTFQNMGGHVNQAAAQLLQDNTSNRNI